MNKFLKKIGICILAVPALTCNITFSNDINNTNTRKFKSYTAMARGFSVDTHFSYVDDHDFETSCELYNGSRFYGYYSMWNAVYECYSDIEDTMYVLCLAQTEIEPNQKTYWDIKGWYNQSMELTCYANTSCARVVDYTPKSFEQDYTEKKTWEIGISVGKTDGAEFNPTTGEISIKSQNITNFNAKFTKTEETYTPSVTASAYRASSNKNTMTIKYNFNNYKNNNKKDCSHALTKKDYMFLFEIEDYSKVTGNVIFFFKYVPTIYRNGNINSNSKSADEPLTYNIKVK